MELVQAKRLVAPITGAAKDKCSRDGDGRQCWKVQQSCVAARSVRASRANAKHWSAGNRGGTVRHCGSSKSTRNCLERTLPSFYSYCCLSCVQCSADPTCLDPALNQRFNYRPCHGYEFNEGFTGQCVTS